MLNTDSRCVGAVIVFAIAVILAQFLWSYFDWPPPLALLRQVLDSEFASFMARNQTLLGALLGLGGLASAYLINGACDRAQQRQIFERAERRMAGVLAREAADLAAACDASVEQHADRSRSAASLARLATMVADPDHLLLKAPAAEIARLGVGASTATRSIRDAARRLGAAIHHPEADEAAARARETAHVARDGQRVFETLINRGPDAADRLRLFGYSGAGQSDGDSQADSATRPSQLLSVA